MYIYRYVLQKSVLVHNYFKVEFSTVVVIRQCQVQLFLSMATMLFPEGLDGELFDPENSSFLNHTAVLKLPLFHTKFPFYCLVLDGDLTTCEGRR